ncbi:MAG: SusC/RagA family TonB-linked outer membrane protein [Sediminibacterium sp.]
MQITANGKEMPYPPSPKILLIMRITAFLLFVACLQVSAKTEAQISLNEKHASLSKLLQSIKKQSGLAVVYQDQLMQKSVPVDIDVKNVSLQQALAEIFKDQPLTFEIIGGKIISVKEKPLSAKQAPVSATAEIMAITAGIDVRGKVTDADGKPLAGASVTVKGTQRSTQTNAQGEFSLSGVDEKAVLVVGFVGYGSKEIKAGANVVVSLVAEVKDLDETVVVAYNTTTKRSNVGAVTVVKGEEVQNLPNRSVDKSLQGLVPGLLVTSGTGQPGGGLSSFVLRGINTADNALDGSTLRNPLLVIDGIPVSQDAQQLRIGSSGDVLIQNPMAQLNPSDIESISVLKDAAAIALYGSKASNGVILITTKKGQSGVTSINFRSQADIASRLKGDVALLSQADYTALLYETYKNTYPTATTDSITGILKGIFPTRTNGSFYPFGNLGDQVYNNQAITTSNELSLSGGNAKSLYYINLELTKQNGIYRETGYDRKSLRVNLENKITDWFKLSTNNYLSYNVQDYSLLEGTYSYGGVNLSAPLLPVYLENGSYLLNYTVPYAYANPLAAMEYNYSRNTSYRILSKLAGEISFSKNLKLTSSIGVDFQTTDAKEKRDPRLYDPKIGSIGLGRITEGQLKNANLITNNVLSFEKVFRTNHSVNVLVAQEAQILTQKSVIAEGTGLRFYSNDQIANTTTKTSDATFSKQTLLSYFGQINYDYKKKYFLSSSLRLDGSSKFGSSEPFGTYWAAGMGWVLSSEPFMHFVKKSINYLKLRGSIGVAGNSGAINRFTKYSLLTAGSYLNASTIAVSPMFQPNNPDVKWEETFNIDFGVEARLFNDKFRFTLDVYSRKTSNLLYQTDLPLLSGYLNILGNIGDIENRGIELSFFAPIISIAPFKWTMSGNWSANQNKLVKANVVFSKVGTYLSNEEGRNFNSYYMPVWAGVDPATGLSRWIDTTGKPNSIYTAAKSQFVGKPQPDGFGSLTNTFHYRRFKLSAQLYYQYGFNVYASADLSNDGQRPFSNQSISALDRWQKPGDIATNPKRTLNNSDGYRVSTRRLYEGDYIRLQNISLSYELPEKLIKRIKGHSLMIYVQGNNLALWTKAKGPDVSEANIQGLIGGSAYPNQRTYSIGLNLSF